MSFRIRLLFALALVTLVTMGVVSYRAHREQVSRAASVQQTFEEIGAIAAVLDALRDSETGQRGYLLTGDVEYLAPYQSAANSLGQRLDDLQRLAADNRQQQQRVQELRALASDKLAELAETIRLANAGDAEGALAVVRSNRGKELMDRIRASAAAMHTEEERRVRDQQAGWQAQAATSRTILLLGMAVLAMFIVFSANAVSQQLELSRRLDEQRLRDLEFEQQLVGIVGHDLRNPITAVRMAASMIAKENKLTESQNRSLERVERSAHRMERIVHDLLDFTQIRLGGGLRTVPQKTDLHVIAAHAVDEARLAYPGRLFPHEQEGNGYGVWDEARLEQVFSNLLSNAIHHGAAGEPVLVRTRGEDGQVLLEVSNRGEPIPPDLLPRLFEPLKGTDGEDQARAQRRSVGLGLFIVKQVVDAHGGKARIASSREAGTTVSIRLPREPEKTPKAADRRPA